MSGTTSQRHYRHRPRREAGDPAVFWGWSPESGRMEMMDLRRYLDSLRSGYDRAIDDLYRQMTALSDVLVPTGAGSATRYSERLLDDDWRRGRGHGRRHHHSHHRDDGCCDDDHDGHGDDCGDHGHHGQHDRPCRHEDCECECCIEDADVVLYARCGEIRVIPLAIENDTHRARENVTLELGEFRSGGGRPMGWRAALRPSGPVTLEPCSTTTVELLVAVSCTDDRDPNRDEPGGNEGHAPEGTPERPAGRVRKEPTRTQAAAETPGGFDRILTVGADVDRCEVGYASIRVEGCRIRPIVVAVAVLPRSCGVYQTGCSCSCC